MDEDDDWWDIFDSYSYDDNTSEADERSYLDRGKCDDDTGSWDDTEF